MNPGKWFIAAVVGLSLLQAGGAVAADAQKVGKADNKQAFDLVVAAVRQEMRPGGRYEFVDGQNRKTVNQKLDEMSSLFNQFGSVDKMDQATRVTLYNDQELVDSILTRDDSNREICQRETSLGSNIPHVTCRTYGEIRRNQRDTQSWMRQNHLQLQPQELGGTPARGGNPVSH